MGFAMFNTWLTQMPLKTGYSILTTFMLIRNVTRKGYLFLWIKSFWKAVEHALRSDSINCNMLKCWRTTMNHYVAWNYLVVSSLLTLCYSVSNHWCQVLGDSELGWICLVLWRLDMLWNFHHLQLWLTSKYFWISIMPSYLTKWIEPTIPTPQFIAKIQVFSSNMPLILMRAKNLHSSTQIMARPYVHPCLQREE